MSRYGRGNRETRDRDVSRTALATDSAQRIAVPRAGRSAICLLAAALIPTHAATEEVPVPFADDEELAYVVAWPSGLSAGIAEFRARRSDSGWRFEMTLSASVPKAEIDDAFVSRTDVELCSLEFEKHIRHGTKRAHEALRFANGVVERKNLDARTREEPGTAQASRCARDALAAVYYLRQDLAMGRIPGPGTVHFGAGYALRMEHKRTRWLAWDSERREADEILVTVRGPASRHEFSAFFARDEARTPLLFRVELEDGPFTMRLAE